MEIITNNSTQNHDKVLNKLIDGCEEIVICVAFLKNSGLRSIIERLKKSCTFYVGIDYYITEPAAIKRLIKGGHSVYFTKKSKSTFHPKIYYLRKGNNVSILTGSANLTGGGLETNFEASILLQTEAGSDIDRQFRDMIDIYSSNSTRVLGELELSQYEREFETYTKKHRKADKEFKDEISRIHKLDITLMAKSAKEYLSSGGFERFEKRVEDYKIAKRLLNQMTKNGTTSAKDFLSHYEVIVKYLHSSGLLRGKTTFAKQYKSIVRIITMVQTNKTAKPESIFSKLIPLVRSTKKFGVNGLTEIMSTYNSKRFSVANGRALKSLSHLGFNEFPVANNFNGAIYEKYNDLVAAISITCNFNDLAQVDHFLSWYYEKYVKKN